jgi:hypothetical protein
VTKRLLLFAGLLLLSGCSPLASIPYSPPQTPASWLTIQPFIAFKIGTTNLILIQPSTTFFVYLLGLICIGVGVYFLRIRSHHWSRLWWGVALILWGLGALLAGTSYEAFSYAIKCAGRAVCSWTSWWEVLYLVLSVASVDAMLLAEAYACTTGKWRKILAGYALLNAGGYAGVVLLGAVRLEKFLISFELLLLVAAPTVLIFIALNAWRYARYKEGMDLALLGTWGWLAITLGAYFLYLVLGWTERLWARGLWFSANDVLHIGLIIWMLYIARVVARRVEDWPKPERAARSAATAAPSVAAR